MAVTGAGGRSSPPPDDCSGGWTAARVKCALMGRMSTERHDCATELRQTSVSGNGKPLLSRPRFNPARIFIEKDRLAWFWFGVAMLVLVAAAFDRYYLVQSFKQRERIVVVDPANTFYVSPLLKFQEAKELHAQQSTLASIALLERNPKGFDQGELLKQMFLKRAVENASALRLGEEPEFKAKQLHQKAEISKIEILNTGEDFVLTQVNGQLIRTGLARLSPGFAAGILGLLIVDLLEHRNNGSWRQSKSSCSSSSSKRWRTAERSSPAGLDSSTMHQVWWAV